MSRGVPRAAMTRWGLPAMSTAVSRGPLTSPPIAAPLLDLSTPHRIHVVGAGGSGMSAIAGVLLAMGHTVSGSDAAESPVLERLRAGGAKVHAGHDAASVAGVDVVVVSTAIPADDPEVVAARA